MKFRITMKDPDGPSDCVHEAASDSLEDCLGLTDSEKETLHEIRMENIWEHVCISGSIVENM